MSAEKITLRDVAEEFLSYLEGVRRFSPNTVIAYRNDYALLAEILGSAADSPVDGITADDLRACLEEAASIKKKESSLNRFIASTRSLFSYCRRWGYTEVNPAEGLKSVRQPRNLPLFMFPQEAEALCAEPERTGLLWEKRDAALFAMLYSSGCRVSEAALLTLGDFSRDFETALVRGKGNKDRLVFFDEKAVAALRDYLPERDAAARAAGGRDRGAVFLNRRGLPLTPRGIRYIVARYSGVEGVNRHVYPHAFRHTFATQMLANGADVRVVQEMLGHSNISTTQRYTHVTTERLKGVYHGAHPHGGQN
ncbi:MAG: tyrosine-type recombinase/integrase [Spirochaetaceae bacterium]|jgi:integrase/recombinase XerC|nr:tyrosine-type recombinase/integrase [Spirochaetaceae bacterium]